MHSNKIKRILIIKPGAMGDLLHLTPTIRGLRRRFPHARIDILVGNAASTDLFRHHPDITDILVYDRHGEHRSFKALFSLWQRIRNRSYDLVINFQRRNLKTWFLTSAALPCRILVYCHPRLRDFKYNSRYIRTDISIGYTHSAIFYAILLFDLHIT